FWHPISLNFMQNVVNGNQNPVIAITEGCQFFLIPSSNYMELLTNTLDHENWSLVQFLMSSSYSGYDTSNLQQFLVLEFELEIHFFQFPSPFGYSPNPNGETLPLPALRQSAALTSLTQHPARHPLRLTGGLSSEETNSTNSARHPLRTADPPPANSPVS
ncbi:hypothetical protein HN51_030999, partial [Arachis hypogaea]